MNKPAPFARRSRHALALLLLLLSGAAARAADLYVATTGSDQNAGTALSAPLRTLQAAVDKATPGTTIYVRGGTYTGFLYVQKQGAAGQFITLSNYNNEAVWLEPDLARYLFVQFYQAAYVRLRGLGLRNFTSAAAGIGLYVGGGSHHVEFVNCHVTNFNPKANRTPILIASEDGTDGLNHPVHDVLFDRCEIDHCYADPSQVVSVTNNCYQINLTNCYFHDTDGILVDYLGNRGKVPDPAADAARDSRVSGCRIENSKGIALYVDGGHDITFENNRLRNCHDNVVVAAETTDDSGTPNAIPLSRATANNCTVRNNLIVLEGNLVDAQTTALAFGSWDLNTYGSVDNCRVTGNTIVNNTPGTSTEVWFNPRTTNCVFQNNLVFSKSEYALRYAQGAQVACDYNLWFDDSKTAKFIWNAYAYGSLADYRAASGQDAHSVSAAPQFADAAGGNYALAAASPARDAGNPAYAAAAGETDLAGQPRVQGGRVDIGAYESAVTATPGATYYRIKNRWQGVYLFDNGDRAGYAATASGDACLWAVETSGGYTQFKNKATGDYLNVETGQDYVECTPAQAGWWSKDWTLEARNGSYQRLRNRWQSTQYVHVENLRGYAHHTPIALGTWSSEWTLEAVNSAAARATTSAADPAEAEKALGLWAYPNPSPDGRATVRLSATQAQRATVQVCNERGARVSQWTGPVPAGQTEIKLPAALPPGTYHLQTRLDGKAQQFTLKVE